MIEVSSSMVKPRDVSFDVLKGIGICLVLVAHSLGGYVHTFAYSFHMPLFFLVAGYFFKPRDCKKEFALDFRRIMVPFFFAGILMLLLAMAFSPFNFESVKSPSYALEALIYGNGSSVNYHKIFGNFASIGSVWFLGALFWSRQIFNFLLNKTKGNELLTLVCVIGVISCLIGQYIQLPYSMIQGLTAIPFLYIGYVAKNNNLLTAHQLGGGKSIVVISVALWGISTFFGWLDMAQVRWKLFYFPNVLLATAGTYFFYLVSKMICRKTIYVKQVLAFLGKYSLVLVCFPVVETYVLPLGDIVPQMPMSEIVMIGLKVLWCALTLLASLKIPVLRKIFSIK